MKLHSLIWYSFVAALFAGSLHTIVGTAPAAAPATHNLPRPHPAVFDVEAVERVKQFFIANASLQEQPKDSNWRPGYRHKCINTVRAAIDLLFFGESSIPDSLYSRQAMLNGNFQNNDINDLAKRLYDQHFIRSYDTVRFLAVRKNQWVPISKADPVSRGLPPEALEKSLWNTLLKRVGKERGFSVFLVSVCDGYYAALLTFDHRNPADLKVYWGDQTHKHPWRYFANKKLEEVPGKFGWEVMHASGTEALVKGAVRGLDNYMLYANKKFWCDCGRANQKPTDCCGGNCFPFIQVWRLQRFGSRP